MIGTVTTQDCPECGCLLVRAERVGFTDWRCPDCLSSFKKWRRGTPGWLVGASDFK